MTYTTIEVTASELKRRDPKAFDQAYWRWVENAYWEPAFEYTLGVWAAEHGVHVDASDISYSGFYSQGDGLAFDARVDVRRIMDKLDLKTKAIALYQDILEFGTNFVYVRRSNRHSICFGAAQLDYSVGNCYPTGVFSDLPAEDWDALVSEQFDEWGDAIEQAALDIAKDLAANLYAELRDDYEYCTSEDQFIEHCECNEVTFEIEIEAESESCF